MRTAVVDQGHLLRLHVDHDGFVWYGDDSTAAKNTMQTVDEFCESRELTTEVMLAHVVRLLGCRENAKLVIKIHRLSLERTLAERAKFVQLCSPAVCSTVGMRTDPRQVLQTLWQPERNNSLPGHWTYLDNTNISIYLLANALIEKKDINVIRALLRSHPTWAALSFIPYVDALLAAELITRIGDPRWFQHPSRPHRPSRLYAYLGLTPSNVAAVLNSKTCRNVDRTKVAVYTWYNRESCDAFSTAANAKRPENFLWRVYAKQTSLVKGVLRGTERFIDFLQHMWSKPNKSHKELGFCAERFFKSPDEIAAFSMHMRQFDRCPK